jgi:hypothetical protein
MSGMTSPGGVESRPMRCWRKRLVSGVIVFIIAGYMYDSIRQHANWPFHPFTMFSVLPRTRSHSVWRLVGVDKAGRELFLSDPGYSNPILIYHVRLAFARAIDAKDCAKLQKFSREYLDRYARHRIDGMHAGPELAGLRMYELKWNAIDPWAKNVATPDQKILAFDSQLRCPDALMLHTGAPGKNVAAAALP